MSLVFILFIFARTSFATDNIHFYTELTNEATVPLVENNKVTGSANASLVNTKKGLALKYQINTNMDVNAGWPATSDISDDISKIHLHNNIAGLAGPHVLNIYKSPAQDDDNLKIFANKGQINGRWDSEDINKNGLPDGPDTEPFDNNQLLELCEGKIYVNIHGTYPDGMSDTGVLRGNFIPTRKGKKLCNKLLKN